jgi:hypothetical protein
LPKNNKADFIFRFVGAPEVQWKHIQRFLHDQNIATNRDECINLLITLGGDATLLA